MMNYKIAGAVADLLSDSTAKLISDTKFQTFASACEDNDINLEDVEDLELMNPEDLLDDELVKECVVNLLKELLNGMKKTIPYDEFQG
jgi:hypothetical protein